MKKKGCRICGSEFHSAYKCAKNPKLYVKKDKKTSSRSGFAKPRRTKPLTASQGHKQGAVSRTQLKKKLEKLVKQYIKERDGYICQKCDKKVEGVNCQASHVFPVGSCAKLQFEPLNMKVLCYHCHLNWWHKNPLEASEWFKAKFPERYAILEYMKLNAGKISTPELQDLIEEYKLKIEP